MITNCPVCGKAFDVLWPHLYRYKMNSNYFCSWTCYRLKQNRKKEDILNKPKQKRPRMTPDEMATAMRIWREGGDIDTYLKEHGITNISKWKANARARKPAESPKTAGDAMIAMKEAADNFFSQCEDMGLKMDTPKPIDGGEWERMETPEVPKRAPLVYDGYTVCCIESKTFGRFYWDRDHNHLDWTTAEGEEVSFTPTGWKMFLEELPKVAEILGVEL